MSKISLRHIDVIMSFRAATAERTENLYTILRHLDRTYTDYRLWLMEADKAPTFEWNQLQDPKVRHVFLHHTGQFPKSLLYNTGVRLASSPVICFHDADSISDPPTLKYCVDQLFDADGSDVLCPFHSMINVSGATKQAFVQEPDFARFSGVTTENLPEDFNLLYQSNNGCIGVFRKSEYIRVGGYNPALEGWGGEDDDLLSRGSRLGVRWHSMLTSLFHLHHDSKTREDLITDTRESFNTVTARQSAEMPIEDLQALASRLSLFFA